MNMPKQLGVKGYWQQGHQVDQGKYSIERKFICGGFGVTHLARGRKSQQVVLLHGSQKLKSLYIKAFGRLKWLLDFCCAVVVIKTLNQNVQLHDL